MRGVFCLITSTFWLILCIFISGYWRGILWLGSGEYRFKVKFIVSSRKLLLDCLVNIWSVHDLFTSHILLVLTGYRSGFLLLGSILHLLDNKLIVILVLVWAPICSILLRSLVLLEYHSSWVHASSTPSCLLFWGCLVALKWIRSTAFFRFDTAIGSTLSSSIGGLGLMIDWSPNFVLYRFFSHFSLIWRLKTKAAHHFFLPRITASR